MVNSFLATIGKAIKSVNPNEVRSAAERSIDVGLMATTEAHLNEMWFFLAPEGISDAKRQELAAIVHPLGPQLPGMPPPPPKCDVEIWEAGMRKPSHAFTYRPDKTDRLIEEILEKHEDLTLPLARHFLPFRKPAADMAIAKVCNENAMFSIVTSLPNIVPSFISLPYAVGEFASDTAFLTMNQLRMAFLLAGIHDQPIGYREQKAQVASVVAGAFGWRAIARELVGKIPLGGGVVAKAAVAYAGTWVVGRSLERLHRAGGHLSREERRRIYEDGLERGKAIAQKLYDSIKNQTVKK
jgi:uncharacterized protein (DUF697 family)